MPWRHTKNPYRILVAEYLLQRTRIASGTPYYERFLAQFPDVTALASASEENVLRAWEGLGFYRRARNVHAAAKAIVREHGGRIPPDAATLATLPGIGPYTAGAIASIAFGERVPAVDGNVTRVLARLFRVETDVTTRIGRTEIAERAGSLVPELRPGTFNQALMELGSTICIPLRPACATCPLETVCLARAAGLQFSLPRTRGVKRPESVTVSFAFIRSRGRTLLVRRGKSELLGGLWAFPGGEVPRNRREDSVLRNLVETQTGLHVDVREEVARINHTFSHRRWSGAVYRCVPRKSGTLSAASQWVSADEADRLPLIPSHRKLLEQLASRRSLESVRELPPRRTR
jgi:A/G-specific adenine glycosylase